MSKTRYLAFAAVLVLVALAAFAYRPGDPDPAPVAMSDTPAPATSGAMVAIRMPASLSAEESIGQRMFNGVCAACHGENGVGRDGAGPPLIHKIYEPSHHGDESFQIAVRNGVRAHHWRFGNMPPQAGLSRADVGYVVAFIRRVQRENGIE